MLGLLRVKYHQLLMLRDRGYDIKSDPNYNLVTYQFSQLDAAVPYYEELKEDLRKHFSQEYRHEATGHKCFVQYWAEPGNSVSKSVISDLAEYAYNHKVTKAILISDKKLSPPANAQLGELASLLTHFLESALTYNPLGAAIVPTHRLLSEREAAQIFDGSTITKGNLPLIHTTDPPIKWLDGQPGQVVEIKRRVFGVQSTMCPDTLVYRIVVKGK